MQKDDVIYRKAAIDEIEFELEMINSALDSMTLDFNARERLRQRKGEAREILNSIQQLPSAQRWIPCSERLPKVRQWVLCQCRAGIMDVLRLTADGSWNKDYPHAEYMSGFVVAWMPLPEPYEVKNG